MNVSVSPSSFATENIWASYSPEDRHKIARIKRFVERWAGDQEFRASLGAPEVWKTDGLEAQKRRNVAASIGCDFDPIRILPIITTVRPPLDVSAAPYNGDMELISLWVSHIRKLTSLRQAILHNSYSHKHPAYNQWKTRQIRRVSSEIGDFNGGIVHPLVAFELSKGCSVGCWFCGISAEKFSGYRAFDHSTEDLWRGMLRILHAKFDNALKNSFCYWATDPIDNPDYAKYIESFYDEIKTLPQTTTAAPLKNITLTRDILSLFNMHGEIVNRFSITTVRNLRAIHAEFTPDELISVEFVLQNKESVQNMQASAGRAFGKKRPHGEYSAYRGTIACVSGFLISLVDHTIKLVTPTHASEQWPNGYIVLGEATFSNLADFQSAIDHLSESWMTGNLGANSKIAFRSDLRTELNDGKLVLTNSYARHSFEFSVELANLFAEEGATPKSMTDYLIGGYRIGVPKSALTKAVMDLYQSGLFVEVKD